MCPAGEEDNNKGSWECLLCQDAPSKQLKNDVFIASLCFAHEDSEVGFYQIRLRKEPPALSEKEVVKIIFHFHQPEVPPLFLNVTVMISTPVQQI